MYRMYIQICVLRNNSDIFIETPHIAKQSEEFFYGRNAGGLTPPPGGLPKLGGLAPPGGGLKAGGLIAPPGGRGIGNLRGGGGYINPAWSGIIGVPIALSVSQ